MDEFSFPGFAVALGVWVYWYYSFLKILSFRRDKTLSVAVGLAPPICMVSLLPVLLRWSSPDVRSDGSAILFYMIVGTLWLRVGLFLLSLTGVSVREDVLERQNRAAAWMTCGTMAGTTFCFAGANIGRGPGPDVVLFCAVLSTAAFFGLWLCLERMARLGDRITIERDEGAGIRNGAWCAAAGLIVGSAVTGDWKSADTTMRDFVRFGWGAIPFLLVAVLLERVLSRRTGKVAMRIRTSAAIGAAYLLAAGAYVAWRNAR